MGKAAKEIINEYEETLVTANEVMKSYMQERM